MKSTHDSGMINDQLLPGSSFGPGAESHFAAIIEFSDEAIISTTPDGIIATWSPGAARMFGYSTLEIIGKPVRILIPPDRIEEGRLILARVASGEGINEFETVRLKRDGTAMTVWVSTAPIKNHEGRIIGISKIARDITQRKRTEEVLPLHARPAWVFARRIRGKEALGNRPLQKHRGQQNDFRRMAEQGQRSL
jgi:PAS domain S-box-containing protein